MNLYQAILLGLVFMAPVSATANETVKSENSNNPIEKREKMSVTALTKAGFLEKVYNFEKNPDRWTPENKKPCIIDFFATWCGPCKALSPVLEEAGKKYGDKIDVYKMDIDKESELTELFGIRSVPTLLFCPVNETPRIVQGAMPQNQLEKLVGEILLK